MEQQFSSIKISIIMLISKDILEHFLKKSTLDFIPKYIVQDV